MRHIDKYHTYSYKIIIVVEREHFELPYHKSGCCVAVVTQQPGVPPYTGIYQMRCTAYKVAPDDERIQSETCRASNGK